MQSGLSNRVYVAGLDGTLNEQDLRSYFEQYGALTDVYIPNNAATGQKKHFGFVTFADPMNAKDVMNASPHQVKHIMVDIKPCLPKGEIQPKGTGKGCKGKFDGHGAANGQSALSTATAWPMGSPQQPLPAQAWPAQLQQPQLNQQLQQQPLQQQPAASLVQGAYGAAGMLAGYTADSSLYQSMGFNNGGVTGTAPVTVPQASDPALAAYGTMPQAGALQPQDTSSLATSLVGLPSSFDGTSPLQNQASSLGGLETAYGQAVSTGEATGGNRFAPY